MPTDFFRAENVFLLIAVRISTRIKFGRDRYNCSAEWDYLDETIKVIPHENVEQPIHTADIVASAIHKAIEPKRHGMIDDRFSAILLQSFIASAAINMASNYFPEKKLEK